MSDIYIDDIVCGCNTVEEALTIYRQLIQLLKGGGFELRKWSSNSLEFLSHIPESHQACLSFDQDAYVKILGLQWQPSNDVFSYKIDSMSLVCTKRTILSDLARIFDPLGFLSPLTLFAKHLIQHLWILGLSWDQTPPNDVVDCWTKFKSQLSELSSLQLNRRLGFDNFESCQLHGFCDASMKGYSAVIYCRFSSPEKTCISLIIAKSKASPLKSISLPRLELCAAVLLSNLISFVLSVYKDKLSFTKIYCWSDSTVALSWIKSAPHKWKTFVSNRVSQIQNVISPKCWYHIRGDSNPADCASRGLYPLELLKYKEWWEGPAWLSLPENLWPIEAEDVQSTCSEIDNEEKRVVLVAYSPPNIVDTLLERFSSIEKIKRIIAYCNRFCSNCRHKNHLCSNFPSGSELYQAFLLIIKHVQYTVFADEICSLKGNRPCSKPMRKLAPFLDEAGVLRVGGRLTHSSLKYNPKHPILLPGKHRLTELIIDHFHRTYLHPGVQTLHFFLSQQFWILSSKRAIKGRLSRCLTCFRVNPKSIVPFMGNLPRYRVNQVKPFSYVGVDFAGPFRITLSKTRGSKSLKAYICIFVCFATKAIHIEVASDLSSEAFLAALRRFIARRGRCDKIFSDCGTNFVGAHNQLLNYMKGASEQENLEWSFNPPSAPHFGGLWEAGVKSFKSHFVRIVGDQILTFEELNTIAVQIEAVLNSRPLCSVSSDPHDLLPLTPGHFLTLEPLTALPDPDVTSQNINRLNRWQLLQNIHQHFWKRWHGEYLNTLQQRQKWNQSCNNLEENTMVIVKNELMPPLKWRIGRVIKLHPGQDGICRVATIRTAQGVIQRPVVKLCPLPSQ